MTTYPTPFDRLPPDVRALTESLVKLLQTYMPGTCEIEMLVGRNVSAKLTIIGGPLTREVIDDTITHLAFYKRYFPKPGEADNELTSADQILNALVTQWEAHREAMAAHGTTPEEDAG